MYVQVAVNLPLTSGVFDYHLPSELEGQVQPGCLVVVPFSHQTVQGIVLRLKESTSLLETRPVEALLDPRPVLTKTQIALAQVLAEDTLAPLASCLDNMLPPGLSQHADSEYSLRSGKPLKEEIELSPFQRKLLALIRERGALRGRQIAAAFPRREWKPAAQSLVRWGWLQSRPVLPPPSVRARLTRTVQLSASLEMLEANWGKLGRGEAGVRRQAMIRFLQNEGGTADAAWVYAASGGNLADLKHLQKLGLVVLSEGEVWRDPLESIESTPQTPPHLTSDQESAWQQIKTGIQLAIQRQPISPFLLHGVTGSGKTELYLRAVEETLRAGRQAIVLVPEIALTPQTVRRFLARFPGQVGLIHSRLSPGERYDTWRRARQGLLSVIVGPRSALFTPLPDPGLIVVDECHDDSYYQSENPPYYHAVSAAIIYARLASAVLVLGSATPPVHLTFRAEREGWHILKLPLRILAHRQAVENQLQRLAGYPATQQGYNPPQMNQNGDSTA
ncbi:MAG: DEAD/DEAH box helicase, partial [Anaerolineales bacterium]